MITKLEVDRGAGRIGDEGQARDMLQSASKPEPDAADPTRRWLAAGSRSWSAAHILSARWRWR
jgi:hypothetical protein